MGKVKKPCTSSSKVDWLVSFICLPGNPGRATSQHSHWYTSGIRGAQEPQLRLEGTFIDGIQLIYAATQGDPLKPRLRRVSQHPPTYHRLQPPCCPPVGRHNLSNRCPTSPSLVPLYPQTPVPASTNQSNIWAKSSQILNIPSPLNAPI